MDGFPYELDDDAGLNFFLEELIENDYLEGAALGIAKQVVDKGTASLSDKQHDVFQKHILNSFLLDRCDMCGDRIPWSEKLYAYINGGTCCYCQHKLDRLEVE